MIRGEVELRHVFVLMSDMIMILARTLFAILNFDVLAQLLIDMIHELLLARTPTARHERPCHLLRQIIQATAQTYRLLRALIEIHGTQSLAHRCLNWAHINHFS